MSITILLIIIVSTVLPLAFVFRLMSGLGKEQKEVQRLLQSGLPAQGRILNIAATGTSVAVMGARHLRVQIFLEVYLPNQPPYQAQIQPLVSELLIPSIQPGGMVNLRVDPQNALNIAIAGAGAPVQAPGYGMGQPAYGGGQVPGYGMGQAGYGGGQAPGYGMGQPAGFGHAPYGAGMPMQGLSPALGGAHMQRAGRSVILMVVLTTVPVMGIMAYTFIDFSAYFGGDGAPKGGWCKAVVACCKVDPGSVPAMCDKWGDGMPVEGCKSAYQTYKDAAKGFGRSCE